ncbi:MAG: glycoside hydrolase family 3 N-terminal domain-containing protein [Actinomycetes bacterium]
MRALGATLGVLALVMTGCAQVPPGASPGPAGPASVGPPAAPTASAATSGSEPSATPARGGTCSDLAGGLSLREQAGQLVMVGVTGELDAAESGAITGAALGSVILMGNTDDGVAGTRARTDSIARLGGRAGMLVAVDQEGGRVQRLKGAGFDVMPSARDQAELTLGELTAASARWGRQLADAGVHLTLAPVADVVPAAKMATNEPIGKLGRGYGTTPDAVAARVQAFVTGMQDAGVGTSPKHFPNLGQVTGNTDFTARVVDDVTTADDPALAPYRAAIEAGAETVMVGTAWYTEIDPSAPAAFSPAVVSILRDELAFPGVIVSDDLGVAEAVADVPARDRAVRFVRAGGDLAISVDVAAATAMVDGLVAAAQADPALAQRVQASARRVVELKGGLGAATCEVVLG